MNREAHDWAKKIVIFFIFFKDIRICKKKEVIYAILI